MTARVIPGPWRARTARPWPDEVPVGELATPDQCRIVDALAVDVRGLWPDLTDNEKGWLRSQLPAVRPLRAAALTPTERARVADALGLVLRRVGGWAL